VVDFVDRYLIKALAVFGVLFLLGALVNFVASLPPRRFTILTGREGEGNYQAALAYREIARDKGFDLDIRPTAGSAEVLQRLMDDEASVGFVQSGLARGADPKVLASVASVYYEPVWVFYRRDAFDDQGLKNLADLEGKRVAIGETGSGTQILASQLLSANGVNESNAALAAIGAATASAALVAGEVDAAILVTSEKSETVQRLLRSPGIAVMDFERADAYAELFPYLKVVTLPRGAIDLQQDIPDEQKRLVATTANLVARHDVHPDLLRLLTVAAVEAHWDGGLFGKPGEFPNGDNVDLPMDRHERAYLDRIKSGQLVLDSYLPFWLAAIADRYWLFILPILFLFVPILFRVPLAFAYWNRYKVNRWYIGVREVERKLDQLDVYQLRQERASLEALDDRLTTQTNVGRAYLPAAYDLHIHVEYVIRKIRRRERMLLAQVGEAGQAGQGHTMEAGGNDDYIHEA
jgi:TRAP transporter TAXI family solute receptor